MFESSQCIFPVIAERIPVYGSIVHLYGFASAAEVSRQPTYYQQIESNNPQYYMKRIKVEMIPNTWCQQTISYVKSTNDGYFCGSTESEFNRTEKVIECSKNK